MPRFVYIPDEVAKKIFLLRTQGLSYERISIETGVTINIIRNRLGKMRVTPSSKISDAPLLIKKKPIQVRNKYDYLLDEKICHGKMYNEYKR